MYTGKLIFSQVMDFMPMHTFRRCVTRYQGDYKVKKFTCLDQYLCMAFAQITYRESLRDIEVCLRAQEQKLYHMGIRDKVSRSTIADANEQRNWRIYADLAYSLINTARKLYSDEPFAVELEQTAYALDATTIDLCLSMFPWATFRQNKGAIKLHTLLDLRCNIPTFIHISDGKLHEINTLDIIPFEPGSFYVMDRGYLDFSRLYNLSQTSAFFVIRAKSNLRCRRIYSHPVDRTTGLICDQTIMLTGCYQSKDYPEKLRRVKYYDAETDMTFVFLTNNFKLPALNSRRSLSLSLASGTLFQMDQTTSAHQEFLWNIGKCSKDTNLDRHLRLHYCGYTEKTTSSPRESLHNFTGSEHLSFRKNAALSTNYEHKSQNGKPYVS